MALGPVGAGIIGCVRRQDWADASHRRACDDIDAFFFEGGTHQNILARVLTPGRDPAALPVLRFVRERAPVIRLDGE